MKVWTWHKPDFSLLNGHVDPKRSEYVQSVTGVAEAYRHLAALIGTSQFVWCYTIPGQRIQLPCHTEVEWTLDVPSDSILGFVDDIVWNRILGIRCGVSSEMREAWRNEAMRSFPHDAAARGRHLTEQEESFWTQALPGERWWESLFVEPEPRECVSALVPHPVAKKWVLVNPNCGR